MDPRPFSGATGGKDELVQKLAQGFDTLRQEYRTLLAHHNVLERKLQTARDQYNDLAKLYGEARASTPPLSLASSHKASSPAALAPTESQTSLILDSRSSGDAVCKIRQGEAALDTIRNTRNRPGTVRIWSGPSADRPSAANSSLMPSISESPLEQDFTVEGVPSRLDCPFASMANKKLSSHAASIMGKYSQRNGRGPGSTLDGASGAASVVSRIDGSESINRHRAKRASGLTDPIKAEICGMSDHSVAPERTIPAEFPVEAEQQAEAGVCPIRFLNQHSPDELATYFENHKHELPRSHEVCVKRYQSNEEQIKQLDAKYGNLVSMIQGLGHKHQSMLPLDPGEGDDTDSADVHDKAKIENWARSVSAQAMRGLPDEIGGEHDQEEDQQERQPHFERELREIRVGESPSRPWGYQIPLEYHANQLSQDESGEEVIQDVEARDHEGSKAAAGEATSTSPKARCPFGFDQTPGNLNAQRISVADKAGKEWTHEYTAKRPETACVSHPENGTQKPTTSARAPQTATGLGQGPGKEQSHIVISGPVLIGYSAEDAAKFLRESGIGHHVRM